MDDNRNHMRYTVRDNLLVAIGSTYARVGSLNDISLGGLSFEYMNFDNEESEPAEHVSLLHTPSGFSLPDIPCRIVYDLPVTGADSRSGLMPTCLNKRCGLEFIELQERHRSILGQFLQEYRDGYRY